MSLETITGNLRDGYRQLQPGTMLHVDQLINERRINEELRGKEFYTADGEIYFLDGIISRTPALAITREAQNPVLKNIDYAFEQLTNNGNYSVLHHDFEQALAAPEAVIVALPTLRLQGDNVEWRYLKIRTDDGFIKTGKKYEAPNSEEQKVKERFGYTPENLAMLRNSKQKIKETRLYLLNPAYVQKHAEKGAIARASWLDDFDSSSGFGAGDRDIYYHSRVRGVRREVVEAFRKERHERSDLSGTQKNQGPYRTAAKNGFAVHYDVILADPESAVKSMDDKTAAGLSKLLSSYLDTRGQ